MLFHSLSQKHVKDFDSFHVRENTSIPLNQSEGLKHVMEWVSFKLRLKRIPLFESFVTDKQVPNLDSLMIAKQIWRLRSL